MLTLVRNNLNKEIAKVSLIKTFKHKLKLRDLGMPVSFIECFNIKLSLMVQTSSKDFTNRQIA